MKIIFTWKEIIILNGITEIARFLATCKVRTELNGQRKKDQVIYTVNKRPKPYYPRQFPSGIHRITEIEWVKEGTERFELFGPVIIKTDAERKIFTWDLDREGNYWEPTGNIQVDTGYYIHHTHRYLTTHGCIRGGNSESEMVSMAKIIEPTIEELEDIFIEVL
jgi:hypothetical protein